MVKGAPSAADDAILESQLQVERRIRIYLEACAKGQDRKLIDTKSPKWYRTKDGRQFRITATLQVASKARVEKFRGDAKHLAAAIDKWYGNPFM